MSKNSKLDIINSKKVAIYIRVQAVHQVDKDSLTTYGSCKLCFKY